MAGNAEVSGSNPALGEKRKRHVALQHALAASTTPYRPHCHSLTSIPKIKDTPMTFQMERDLMGQLSPSLLAAPCSSDVR